MTGLGRPSRRLAASVPAVALDKPALNGTSQCSSSRITPLPVATPSSPTSSSATWTSVDSSGRVKPCIYGRPSDEPVSAETD